jgi:hypothetical protein
MVLLQNLLSHIYTHCQSHPIFAKTNLSFEPTAEEKKSGNWRMTAVTEEN